MSESEMSKIEEDDLLAPFRRSELNKKGFFSLGRKRRDDDVFGQSTSVFDEPPSATNVFDGPSSVFGTSNDTSVFYGPPSGFGTSNDTSGLGGPSSGFGTSDPFGPTGSSSSNTSSSSNMFNWLPRVTTNSSSNNSFINYIIQFIFAIVGIVFSPFFFLYKGISKGSSSSSSVGNGGYSFLNPSSLQSPSAVALILILLVFVVLIIYWAYIKSNWEQVKCKDGRFWIAPLFGKSTQETIKDCTTKEIQLTVNKNLQDEINHLAQLDASVNNLQTQIDNSSGEATTLENDTNSTLTNITNILESNINYVKGALSTILASIYISSNLNKGALTSYADLQKSDIAEIIDKIASQ